MQLHMALTLTVDEDAYARDYGLAPGEVGKDAQEHVPTVVLDAVQARAQAMGYFTLIQHSAVVLADGPTQPGQVVPAPTWHPRLPAPDSRVYATVDPRVLVARWGPDNWRTAVECDDGWDHTGPWHLTMAGAIAAAPAVVRTCF